MNTRLNVAEDRHKGADLGSVMGQEVTNRI
jgi:hypothetical protein